MQTARRLLAVLGLFVLTEIAPAAEIEITPFLGYQLGGGFDTREGDLTIDPAANFGLSVSARTRHDGLVELLYSRQATTLQAEGLLLSGELFDLDVEYFHFGGLWEIRTDRTRPILGLSFGATRLSPGASGIEDEWAFSAGISGGVKHLLTDRLALRLEGRGRFHPSAEGAERALGTILTDDSWRRPVYGLSTGSSSLAASAAPTIPASLRISAGTTGAEVVR